MRAVASVVLSDEDDRDVTGRGVTVGYRSGDELVATASALVLLGDAYVEAGGARSAVLDPPDFHPVMTSEAAAPDRWTG